jgi:putative ABC transport system permease protein
VRMALGASVAGVFRLVIGDGLRVALLGVALGIAGALGVARFLGTLLFGIEPTDPFTLALTAGILVAIATAACALPAWRASRVDPQSALRAD